MRRPAAILPLLSFVQTAAAHAGATGAGEAGHTASEALAGVPVWQVVIFMAIAIGVGAALGRWVYSGQVVGR